MAPRVFSACALIVALVACGGASKRRDEGSGAAAGEGGSLAGTSGTGATGGTSGTGATGGTSGTGAMGGTSGSGGTDVAGATGTSGTAGEVCWFRGVAHPPNSRFSDGCNDCSCVGIRPGACELQGCVGCRYNEEFYPDGAVIPSSDGGCCTCSADESDQDVECVDAPCDSASRCQELSRLYAEELSGRAMDCNPGAGDADCWNPVSSALECGCPRFVENWHRLGAFAIEWAAHGCGGDVTCGACPPAPTGGHCSPEGRCVEQF